MKIPPASVKKARTIATYGRVPIICLVRQVDAGPRRQATVMVSHNALWGHWGGTNGDEENNFRMRRHFHVFFARFFGNNLYDNRRVGDEGRHDFPEYRPPPYAL